MDLDLQVGTPLSGAFKSAILAFMAPGNLERRARAHAPIIVLALGAAAAYSVYAIQQHLRFESGRDLAIFDQALWHYSRLDTPESSIVGVPSLLGDHLHPILILLAPVYALVSKPETLLVAQAVLISAAAFPIFFFAREKLGSLPALALAASYLVFWGVQAAAGYEFHEVAFSPFLIASAIYLRERERWLPLYLTLAALALVKEDMAIVAAFFGLYVAVTGYRRRGAVIAAAALGYYTVATELLIPHFADGGDFRHWSFSEFGDDLPSSALHALTHPWKLLTVPLDDGQKVETLAYLFLPFLLLSLASRVAVLLIPLIAERMLSSNELFWGTHFHYSLAIAPVVVMGAAAGLASLSTRLPTPRQRTIGVAAASAVILLLNIAAASAVFDGRRHPLTTLLHPSYYHEPPWVGPIKRALATVPDEHTVSVATQDQILPHLSKRDIAIGLARSAGRVDYIVANVVEPYGSTAGNANFRELGNAFARRARYYDPVFFEAGWTVLKVRGDKPSAPGPLSGLEQRQQRQLLRAAKEWSQAGAAFAAALHQCRSDAGSTACQAEAAAFLSAGSTLRPTLARLVSHAPAGCSSLSRYALTALDDLQVATKAVESGDAGAVPALLGRVHERDLAGVVLRPAVLCSAGE